MLAQFNSGGQSGRLAACAIAGCLTLTACANTANMSPAQRAIAESNQRLATTTAEGAVVGALGGAVVGFLATGKVQGALIGAGAGGVVGAAAGYMVAQNNYRRSRSQADLQAAIADANRQANEAWQEAGNAQRIADEARVAAAKVGAQYRAGQITLAEYHSRLATYQQSITDLQAANKRMADQAAQLRQTAGVAGSNGGPLNQSAAELDQSRGNLQRYTEQLRAIVAAEPT